MDMLGSYTFRMWAGQFLIIVFLLGGLLVFAVGAGLIVWNQGMQRVFVVLNRWVSTRRVLKPVEIPRDTTHLVQKYRRWLAAFFVVGACYSLYGLGTGFNERAFISLLGMDSWPQHFAAWLIDSLRWILLLGNAIAIVIGVMLAFFPEKMAALEIKGGRWFSDRKIAKGADTMKAPLDHWVVAHPRLAGWVIAVIGAMMVADFGVMWFRLG
jgi:hypothetical protein